MKALRILITMLAMLATVSCGGGNDEPEVKDEAPEVPSGITLHSRSQNSLSFQWNLVTGATSYQWKLLEGSTEVQTGNSTARNAVVKDLKAGTTYKFAVRSVKGDLISAYSSYLEATTEEEPEPEDPPTPTTTMEYSEFLIPAIEEDGKARAFPGAEGGGMWTTGGRGGSVYHVTNLNDGGEGSLRYGINNMGRPLTIVFDVAGIIPLNSQLNITKGDLTIAGQTAPGDGICLKNYTFRISASNVIVRFIRCRMGDETKTEDDAMQILSHDDNRYANIIIDHCSVSWCTDECASFYGMKDFSFQWNIVSESLRNSVHGKGAHGYGGIWGGENATYHHNLLAHHDSRNARIDHDYVSTQKGPVTLANNVIYNWSGNTTYGGESFNNTGTYRKYNIVNNYYKPGPVTPSNHLWFIDPTTSCSNCSGMSKYGDGTDVPSGSSIVPGHFYMTGNYMNGKSAMTSDNWSATTASSTVISKIKATSPFTVTENQGSFSLQTAEKAFDAVLSYAGACLKRDAVDTRISTETKNGTYTYEGSARTDKNGNALAESKWSKKGLIDTQTDVGGWPEYSATTTQVDNNKDADMDGIPDWFEDKAGLSKTNASDAKAISLDPNKRYTNLEMYLHYLVKDIVAAQGAGGTYTQM